MAPFSATGRQPESSTEKRLVLKRLRDVNLGLWSLRATLARLWGNSPSKQDTTASPLLRSREVLDILNACRRLGSWELAFQSFLRVKEWKLDGQVVIANTCMSTCSELSAWQKALEVLSHMRWVTMEHDLISCNTAVDAWQNWQNASALLQDSLAQDLECDVVSWNSLVRTCGRFSCETPLLWRCALDIIYALPCCGLKEDKVTKTSFAACEGSKVWERAMVMSFLDGNSNDGSEDEVDTLDTLACNALGNCASRAFAWEKAMEMCEIGLYRGLKLDVVSFNSLCSAFERSVRWTLALEVLEEVRKVQLRSNSILGRLYRF